MEAIGSVIRVNSTSKKVNVKDASLLCLHRIKLIQDYISKHKIDGLLTINGVDSRYNPDCRLFTNFILFGCSMYKSGEYSKQMDYDTDELIIMIKPNKVELYITHEQTESILPFLIKVHDLQIHCLHANVASDEDVVEDHKVYSFISMTKDVNKVAIPFINKTSNFDPMAIEKWPLLQAYALENYGSNGFFGLNHELGPFKFDELPIFNTFDLGSLKHLLKDCSTLLTFQWNSMIKNVSNMRKDGPFSFSEINKAFDPITSYLEHGGSGSDKCDINLAKHVVTEHPLFITCSIKESQGSLHCGRTYFFHENVDSSDLILLSVIYDAMAVTVHKTIQRFVSTLNTKLSKLSQYFTKKFTEKLKSNKYPQLEGYDVSSLQSLIYLEAYDVQGNAVVCDSKSSLKTFSVSVNNIKSLEKPNTVYPAMVFQESFIDSHLLVNNDDVIGDDCDLLVITDVIPTYVHWNTAQTDDVTRSDDVTIPCSLLGNDINTNNANFVMEDSYISITSPYSTPLKLRLSDIKEIRTKRMNPLAFSVYIEHYATSLPPYLKRFCLVFWQRGRGIKYATDTLIPNLKDNHVTESSEEIPSDYTMKISNLVLSKSEASNDMSIHYPTYKTFSSHFMLNNLGDFSYSQCDVNPELTTDQAMEAYIFISLLVGIPGGNQEKICSLMMEHSDDSFIVLREPLGSGSMFSTANLQSALMMLSQRGSDPVRVIVIVSGYIEITEVVGAIVHHPDKAVSGACHVSAVNTCIDIRNVFLCNQTSYPKIVEQCQEGWVNNIVVSGVSQPGKDSRVDFLRQINPSANIIEVVNNNFIEKDCLDEMCELDLFHKLALTRHLSTPGWYSKQYIPDPTFLPIQYIPVHFSAELCKARFMGHLKNLHVKEGKVYADRLVKSRSMFYIGGRVKFVEDGNVYSIECTPRSNAITLNIYNKPLPPGTKHCFIFTGYDISEEQVKTWLEGCLPKPPNKKNMYTTCSLTPEEKSMVKKQAALEELPEGWFYNGYQYVSMMEGKRSEHPLFEKYLEDFVKMKNVEIDEYNKKVDGMKVPSLTGGV